MLGEYDATGMPRQEIFWLGDTPVAVRGTTPCLTGPNCTETATAYIWTDHLNTPRELTRLNSTTNGHVSIWRWDSLPFGETEPNGNPSNLGIMTFNHRFPGQYRDSETGLSQNWHRDYDAKLGRYVTSDPIGLDGGLNTYAYAYSRPMQFTDATGQCPICVVVRIAFGAIVKALCRRSSAADDARPPTQQQQYVRPEPKGTPVKTEAQVVKELNEKLKEIQAENLNGMESQRRILNAIASALNDLGYTGEQVFEIMRNLTGGTGFGM
jgi:RHS repeat-associated protein